MGQTELHEFLLLLKKKDGIARWYTVGDIQKLNEEFTESVIRRAYNNLCASKLVERTRMDSGLGYKYKLREQVSDFKSGLGIMNKDGKIN